MSYGFTPIVAWTGVCAIAGFLATARAQSPPPQIDITAIGKVCSGIVSETMLPGRGSFTEEHGYKFDFTSDKAVEVTQSGKLLYKIEKITVDDIANCVAKITTALLQPPIFEQKKCRDPGNGIERYARELDVQRTSPEMSGGHSPGEWCTTAILSLHGEHPLGVFSVVTNSESSRSGCSPFNCPLYTYYCTIHVKTDPIYVEKISPACH
jgi:hypothetical protein